MARFSQQEQNAMRREAARRAQEMQQRVHPTAPPTHRTTSPYADYPPEPPQQESVPVQRIQQGTPYPKSNGVPLFGGLSRLNPTELFSRLDSDSMLILAIMAMIYKDGGKEGCDRKLLMALAYLLT